MTGAGNTGERLRIVVIHHVSEPAERMERHYLIGDFSAAWRRAGHSVVHVAGAGDLPPGDVAIVHVDLSVVPGVYAATAARHFPVVLNGRLRDIRKRRVSAALAPAGYGGPVIVKTDRNFAGASEAQRLPAWRKRVDHLAMKVAGRDVAAGRYPVFPSLGDVPWRLRVHPQLVIERFLPERDDGAWFVRQTLFLAGRDVSWRVRGSTPVVRAAEATGDEEVPTPPAIRARAAAIGLDYGKIDYLEAGGVPVVIDVAKTIGGLGSAPESVSRLAGAVADLWVARSRP
ncbi:MAG: hypothetical protein IT534_12765 [Bauldia sp.]|nr:hypothetical protein [Bauldia sp.]